MTLKRLGVDLGGTKIEVAVLDGCGEIQWRRRLPTPSLDDLVDPNKVYQASLLTIERLVNEAESELKEQFSIGVATPGALSTKNRLMKNCNSTFLNGRPLAVDLEQLLRRPVRLANDADCFALSEAIDGAATGVNCVFGVIIGTGTGGGIVVNQRLLSGPNNIAGEWGHNAMPLEDEDKRKKNPCYCGAFGCTETYLSGPGFEKAYFERSQENLSASDIVALAAREQGGEIQSDERQKWAKVSLDSYFEYMAKALASVINLLDPDIVVLGGGMSNIRSIYSEVPKRWARYVFSDEVLTQLKPAMYGDSSGVRGAAWLWND